MICSCLSEGCDPATWVTDGAVQSASTVRTHDYAAAVRAVPQLHHIEAVAKVEDQQSNQQRRQRKGVDRVVKSRKDLSDWVLHFVHDGNPDHEPVDDMLPYDYFQGFPYHEDRQLNDRFDAWRISDEYYQLDPCEPAIGVLLKIVTDGHIRATWAFRNGRPTIYGPRAAVCLTEMPLYALLDYARSANATLWALMLSAFPSRKYSVLAEGLSFMG